MVGSYAPRSEEALRQPPPTELRHKTNIFRKQRQFDSLLCSAVVHGYCFVNGYIMIVLGQRIFPSLSYPNSLRFYSILQLDSDLL